MIVKQNDPENAKLVGIVPIAFDGIINLDNDSERVAGLRPERIRKIDIPAVVIERLGSYTNNLSASKMCA